jgi:hypothetical protein
VFPELLLDLFLEFFHFGMMIAKAWRESKTESVTDI